MKILGILLVVAGALALYFRGIPYTHDEKLVDLGPIHATAERHDNVAVPPWLAGGVVIAGLALLIGSSRRWR